MTTNIDLMNIARRNNIKLDYIFRKDDLYMVPYKNGTNIILNMASEGDIGTHWVAMKLYKKYILYFDSFGIIPPQEVIEYAKQHRKNMIVYNDYQVEELDGINCGQLSLQFLKIAS